MELRILRLVLIEVVLNSGVGLWREERRKKSDGVHLCSHDVIWRSTFCQLFLMVLDGDTEGQINMDGNCQMWMLTLPISFGQDIRFPAVACYYCCKILMWLYISKSNLVSRKMWFSLLKLETEVSCESSIFFQIQFMYL